MPPTVYDRDLADLICERMARGPSLRSICKQEDIPVDESVVRSWAMQDIDGFAERYRRARELQLDAWADEITEISDDGSNDWLTGEKGPMLNGEHVQRSRLRVDTRKWLMSKIAPKKYGERLSAEVSGPDGGPVQISWGEPQTDGK